MKWFLFLTVFAMNGARGQESEFRRQLEILNERYEDFFAHDERLRRYDARVKGGIPDLKQDRQEEEAKRERARRQQVANRKAEPDTTALEREHERQKAEQAKIDEKNRKEYVRYREQLEKVANTARKIPENRDAGLVD